MIGFVYDNATGDADLMLNADGSLAVGDPLLTAAVDSLFTRARVEPAAGVDLPEVAQGWWADEFLLAMRGRPRGSRLWTLRRAKLDDTTLLLAKAYAEEALAWWITKGLAKSVTATATLRDGGGINLRIEAIRPDGSRWEHLWARRLTEL